MSIEVKRPLARMRLIKEAYDEIKELDPKTAITLTQIKNMVRSNEIGSFRAGGRILINLDELISYFDNGKEYEQKKYYKPWRDYRND